MIATCDDDNDGYNDDDNDDDNDDNDDDDWVLTVMIAVSMIFAANWATVGRKPAEVEGCPTSDEYGN